MKYKVVIAYEGGNKDKFQLSSIESVGYLLFQYEKVLPVDAIVQIYEKNEKQWELISKSRVVREMKCPKCQKWFRDGHYVAELDRHICNECKEAE